MARHAAIVKAKPHFIKFSEKRGYELVVKITEGPQQLVDKMIVVQLTNLQLNTIAEWDEKEIARLDLENLKETPSEKVED